MHLPVKLVAQLYKKIKKALKPGGVFILEAYTPANIGRGYDNRRLFAFSAKLRNLAKKRLWAGQG